MLAMTAINRRGGVHAYVQVADHLRELIDGDKTADDGRLPSEFELIQALGVSRATVRAGFKLLIDEGIAESMPGKGVYVRSTPSRLVLRDPQRTAQSQDGSVAADATEQGFEFSQVLDGVESLRADHRLAEALDLRVGDGVIARRRLVYLRAPADHELRVAKLLDSYYPARLDCDALRSSVTGNSGMHGAIKNAGCPPTRYVEETRCRMPARDEVDRLELAAGVPVIEQLRIAFHGNERVEFLVGVENSEMYEHEYRIPMR